MPRISLTDFVDIVSASGTPKANKVRQVKNRPEYEPQFDFYKQIREALVSLHQSGDPKSQIDPKLAGVSTRKETTYTEAAAGYKKWWGRKKLTWFDPPHGLFARHGIQVSVNPELGLVVNGVPHLLKLYFKAEPLSKLRMDIITHLMEVRLRGSSPQGASMSVLDVRRGKLISPTVPVPGLDAVLNAELAYIAALWQASV